MVAKFLVLNPVEYDKHHMSLTSEIEDHSIGYSLQMTPFNSLGVQVTSTEKFENNVGLDAVYCM